jgi:hypothetical protein
LGCDGSPWLGLFAAGLASEFSGLKTEEHHLGPKQLRKEFERAGLDLEHYVDQALRGRSSALAAGLHTGQRSWNVTWKNFFEQDPSDHRMRYSIISRMKSAFGLE